MSFLLDTHYLLWAISDPYQISKNIKNIITNPENRVFVSTISFWEVSLKSGLGKLEISGFSPENLPSLCSKIGFEIIELSPGDSSTYQELKATHHKDPFDRMLIWQAIRNALILISSDVHISRYKSEGLNTISK
jgi:PIN domain nuclease of toxin-antitoxin system